MMDLVGDLPVKVRGSRGTGGTDSIERGVDGFLHLGLPVETSIGAHIDRALRGDHLCLGGTRRYNRSGVSGQLGRERDALKLLASVSSVEHERGLANNPSLVRGHGGNLKAVVNVFIFIERGE